MSEIPARDHGLGPFLASTPHADGTDNGIGMQILSALGHINLRGNANDAEFVTVVASILGQPLPVDTNTMTLDRQRIYWLGPDEWLIVTPQENLTTLLAKLRDMPCSPRIAVTDVSGGNIVFQLAGKDVIEVLAKGCTMDFHADAFPLAACAQSGLAKANVLIGCIDSQPTYEIIVRRSFSDYLARWLHSAAREFGVRFKDS